jgi:hypothetical protein
MTPIRPRLGGIGAALAGAFLLSACAALPENELGDTLDAAGSGVAGSAKGAVAGALIGCWIGAAKDVCLPAGVVGALIGVVIGAEQGPQEAKERREARGADS